MDEKIWVKVAIRVVESRCSNSCNYLKIKNSGEKCALHGAYLNRSEDTTPEALFDRCADCLDDRGEKG